MKTFLALFLAGGVLMPIFAFFPVTDDFGNPVEIGTAMKVVVIAIGILCLLFSFYLCIPSLFRRRLPNESEELN